MGPNRYRFSDVGRCPTYLLAVALTGCGAEVARERAVDTRPLVLPATVVEESAGAGRFLDGEQVFVERASGYAVWTPGEGFGPTWVGPAGLRDVASAAGVLWLASDAGLYVLDADVFVPSPVGDAMEGEVQRLELSVDGLWIGGAVGLHWYRGDQLVRPSDPVLAAAGGALAYGLMPDASPGIWLLSEATIHGVRARGEGLERFRLPVEDARALAADGAGRLWWTDAAGALFSRAPDGQTWQAPLEAPARALAASPAAPGVWVETEPGLRFVDWGVVRPVEGPSPSARLLDAGAQKALVADGGRLVLVGGEEGAPAPAPNPGPQAPTWSEDVRPLAEQACFLCHGPSASARDLSTREAWSSQWSDIEENVRSARMPLPPQPPLGPAELELLRAWAEAGFPE